MPLRRHNMLVTRRVAWQCRSVHSLLVRARATRIPLQTSFHAVSPPTSVTRTAIKTSLSADCIRHVSTSGRKTIRDIAVLGGGITGLSSAFYAAREYPDAKITVYESNATIGGWMQSKVVDVPGGKVIFERGPRSLRPAAPNGTLAFGLMRDLGLIDDLLITTKRTPAAQNRFVYYPDHLVRMPGPPVSLLENLFYMAKESIFKGSFRAIAGEMFRQKRGPELKDESVGSFLSRRLSPGIANNLASAIFHGIYAGDIWQLSARSILPNQWIQEGKFKSLTEAVWFSLISKSSWQFVDDLMCLRHGVESGVQADMFSVLGNDTSVFTLKHGLGSFIEALCKNLVENPRVTIKTGSNITGLSVPNAAGKIKVTVTDSQKKESSQEATDHDRVISTIQAPVLGQLMLNEKISTLQAAGARALQRSKAVTVCVINLYFATPNLLQTLSPPGGLPPMLKDGLQGFGYLIPNSVPLEQNPERALGVIFDSDISPDLHTTVPAEQLGTRLTVMMGGHWWDGWAELPSEAEVKENAAAVLERHLGITEKPLVVETTFQRDCIPQYTVGHSARLAEAHQTLVGAYKNQVRVAGSWYTGVGVNECIRGAWEVTRADRPDNTGLEKFAHGRGMALVRKRGKELAVLQYDDLGQKQIEMYGGQR